MFALFVLPNLFIFKYTYHVTVFNAGKNHTYIQCHKQGNFSHGFLLMIFFYYFFYFGGGGGGGGGLGGWGCSCWILNDLNKNKVNIKILSSF